MSDRLSSTVAPKSALWHIARIEEACECMKSTTDIEINHGPFGAFRLGAHQNGTKNTSSLSFLDVDTTSGDIPVPEDFLLSFDSWNEPAAPTPADQVEPHDPFSSEPWDISMDFIDEQASSRHVFRNGTTLGTSPALDNDLLGPSNHRGFDSVPSPSYALVGRPVPSDAIFLINYYSNVIINLITPFHHTKTPWHILFIPSCKNCLAALSLGENVDHAALGAFYGTLAMSAFSLSGVSDSSSWLDKAQAYYQSARCHTKQMLVSAYLNPKSFKYKAILIALITMIQVSMFSGSSDNVEYYFVEAEKFIRLRGLKKKKSRKVRILHHCYAFERIFYESTVRCDIDSNHRFLARQAVESSGLVIRGQDSMQFNLRRWNNLDQVMSTEKGQEVGENDLHLEVPGEFSATLYPEIFGLPEQWVVLVSLVVRLGREKDATEHIDAGNRFAIKEFLEYAKTVEKRINRLQAIPQSTSVTVQLQPVSERHMLENLLLATTSALAIYFYRRVYDVEASILQQKVQTVCQCLLRCELQNPSFGSIRFLWPAIIAASEAEDLKTQVQFKDWFTNASRRSGVSLFVDALTKVEQKWQTKRGLEEFEMSEMDLLTNINTEDPSENLDSSL